VEETERVMSDREYDVVLCCGVLMYVNPQAAARLVRVMLARARRMVGLISLAHPKGHHAGTLGSEVRVPDGTFIHDVNRMIREANGRLVSSKWVGTEISGSSPSYVIVAEPLR
jgi:hypothetical protein